MGNFQFERITGGDETISRDSPSVTVPFRATDVVPATVPAGDYFDFVSSQALAWVELNAPIYESASGTLYYQSIQIHENYYARRYGIIVNYGRDDKKSGAYQIQVDQTGGTVHVTTGTVISKWGPAGQNDPAVPDNGGLIGVIGDKVRGADIPVESSKFNVLFRHPGGVLNRQYIMDIGKLTGYPNADVFLGYQPGEVRYMGGNFTETNIEATASYPFEYSPNVLALVIGNIQIGFKDGFDIVSPSFKADVDANGHGVMVPEGYEIIRPAGRDYKEYIPIFGWG